MPRIKASNGNGHNNGVVITYTALFLLLLTFFILLNSMGRVEETRLSAAYRSLQASFGLQQGQRRGPGLVAQVNPVEQDYDYLRGLVNQEDLGREVVMLRSAGQRTLALSNLLLFEETGEELTPGGREFFDKVADAVKDRAYPISISGHLAAGQASDREGQDELTLSGRRALTVLRLLVEKGVAPTRLTAFGLGSQRSLLPPSDPRHRQFSNRVDLTLDARDSSAELLPANRVEPKPQFRGFVFDLLPKEGQGE